MILGMIKNSELLNNKKEKLNFQLCYPKKNKNIFRLCNSSNFRFFNHLLPHFGDH